MQASYLLLLVALLPVCYSASVVQQSIYSATDCKGVVNFIHSYPFDTCLANQDYDGPEYVKFTNTDSTHITITAYENEDCSDAGTAQVLTLKTCGGKVNYAVGDSFNPVANSLVNVNYDTCAAKKVLSSTSTVPDTCIAFGATSTIYKPCTTDKVVIQTFQSSDCSGTPSEGTQTIDPNNCDTTENSAYYCNFVSTTSGTTATSSAAVVVPFLSLLSSFLLSLL